MKKILQNHKTTANKKHMLFIILCVFLYFSLTGCGQNTAENRLLTERSPSTEAEAETAGKTESPVQLYQEIYGEAMLSEADENQNPENLTIVQEITRKLGEHGITAVDSENQVDMVNSTQMEAFIAALKSKETAALTVLTVSAYNRFTQYDLHAEAGALEITKTYYQYENGAFADKSRSSFPADFWQYTDEGYFIFTGKSFSAQSLVLTMSDEEEVAA